jgi:hypothetical protein
MKGATIPHMTQQKLKLIELPVPPQEILNENYKQYIEINEKIRRIDDERKLMDLEFAKLAASHISTYSGIPCNIAKGSSTPHIIKYV